MNLEIMKEIFSLPIEEEVGTMRTLSILNKYSTPKLLMDEKFNLVYKVPLEDIIKSDISTDELIEIHQGGWKIDIQTHFLFKFY